MFSKAQFVMVLASGHGAMILPLPRNHKMTDVSELVQKDSKGTYSVTRQTDVGCEGYACLWFNQGCAPGCDKCVGPSSTTGPLCKLDSFEPWIKSESLITYGKIGDKFDPELYKYSPWRSPGEAPVFNSCGLAAGTTEKNEKAVGISPPGRKNGFPGTDLPATAHTKWVVGETVEVAFGLWANHGGGYQYRLCPADSTLDEECFKKTPLAFASNKQALYWTAGPKANQQVEIEATRVAARDKSIWTKNPIPAYSCPSGGVQVNVVKPDPNCSGPQFPPAIDGDEYWGFSDYNLGKGEKTDHWLPYIKDFVVVPDLAPGHYVLSWRWDAEQTPQVWNSCSDILIARHDVHV